MKGSSLFMEDYLFLIALFSLFLPYIKIVGKRMKKFISKGKIVGESYKRRVLEVNAIYDKYANSGLSNREIIRRYIWPIYFISERTFYNMVNASIRFKEYPDNL